MLAVNIIYPCNDPSDSIHPIYPIAYDQNLYLPILGLTSNDNQTRNATAYLYPHPRPLPPPQLIHRAYVFSFPLDHIGR